MTAMPNARRLVDKSISLCVSRGLTVRESLMLVQQVVDTVTADVANDAGRDCAWLGEIREALAARLAAASAERVQGWPVQPCASESSATARPQPRLEP